MKKLLCIVLAITALAVFSFPSPTQGASPPSAPAVSCAFAYMVRSHTAEAIALTKIGSVTQIPTIGSFDVDAFAGVSTDNSRPVAGFALAKTFPLGPNLNFTAGICGEYIQRRNADFGPLLGVQLRF